MFRSSLKTTRFLYRKQSIRSLSKKFYQTKDDPNRLVPYYTIAACALTSASMYYYFMHRVSNESKSDSSDLAGKTVQVISSPTEIDTVQVISFPAEVETVEVVSSPAEFETEQVEATSPSTENVANNNSDSVEVVSSPAEVEPEQVEATTTPSAENDTNGNSEPVEVVDIIATPSEMNGKPVEIIDVIDTVEVDGEPVVAEENVAVVEAEAPTETQAEAQAGAYNEETGEINWDCPCLGGMADGPCGEEFKSAFSCFVYSKEEPKGIECIPNFKNMQDCFRKYPEYYSEELREEEELTHEVAGDVKAGEMNQEILDDIQDATVEAQGIAAEIKKDLAAAEHAVQEKIEAVNLEAGDAYRQVKKPNIDLYGSAQSKIDDFNKK